MEQEKEKKGRTAPANAKFKITVEDKVAYLKPINRATFEFALNLASPPNPQLVKAGEAILKNCIIEEASDPEMIKDDQYLLPACLKAFELIDLKAAELEKL